MIAAAAVVGFLKNNLVPILLVVAVGGLIASLWVGKRNWENKYLVEVAAHEKTMAAHNLAVAMAADETLRADRAERAIERKLQEAADEARKQNAEIEAAWKAREAQLVGEHRARRGELLDHINRLANSTGAGTAGQASCPAAVSLQERLSTCGQFLARVDDVAERASSRYGEVRNAWAECARDAQAVRLN